MEAARRGDGGLADADRADLVGLDQRDIDQRPQLPRQRRCREPPRRTAPGDDDTGRPIGIAGGGTAGWLAATALAPPAMTTRVGR